MKEISIAVTAEFTATVSHDDKKAAKKVALSLVRQRLEALGVAGIRLRGRIGKVKQQMDFGGMEAAK